MVVSGMLSVLMQLLFWSQVVDPAIGEPPEGDGSLKTSVHIPRVLLLYATSFLTLRQAASC
jgi:hypothetical protein